MQGTLLSCDDKLGKSGTEKQIQSQMGLVFFLNRISEVVILKNKQKTTKQKKTTLQIGMSTAI